MKTSANIISNRGELVAIVTTNLKNGSIVEYSRHKSKESINASREFNLVNARTGKISRAKKWDKEYSVNFGEEINDGEFYIV